MSHVVGVVVTGAIYFRFVRLYAVLRRLTAWRKKHQSPARSARKHGE